MGRGLCAVSVVLVTVPCVADEGGGSADGERGDGDGDGDGSGDQQRGGDADADGQDGSVGFGGDGDGPFEAKGGNPIKMNVFTTSGGAKQFAGWRDIALGVDCGFQAANDGQLRCLPGGSFGLVHYYSNDTCSQALLTHPAICAGTLAGKSLSPCGLRDGSHGRA